MIRHGLTYKEYTDLPGIRWSQLKHIAESPLHCKAEMDAPPDDSSTAEQTILRAAHARVFERSTFWESWSIYDGARNHRHKAYQVHLEKHPNTEAISQRAFDEAEDIALAVLNYPLTREMLSEGYGEVTMTWTDPDTGIDCKARMDWLRDEWHGRTLLLDMKTTTTDGRLFGGMVARNLWHGQLAFYMAGLREHGIHQDEILAAFIAVERKPPHDVAVFELDQGFPDGAWNAGEEVRRRLMDRLHTCLKTNHWPGRHDHMTPVHLPTWALPEAEDFDFSDEE